MTVVKNEFTKTDLIMILVKSLVLAVLLTLTDFWQQNGLTLNFSISELSQFSISFSIGFFVLLVFEVFRKF